MKRDKITGLMRLFLLFSLVFAGVSCKDKPVPVDPVEPFVRLRENLSFQSKLLKRPVAYAVLLPADYDSTNEKYPVVYLLHGFGDTETAWYKGGALEYYLDQFAAETIPMIYVMPQGFNSYYVNKYNGNFPYMDMIVKEMVPRIDSLFRTSPDATHRAVMGYSMGGYGALILPVKNPAVFKTGVVLSMSFRTDQQYLAEPQSVFDYQWGPNFGGIGAHGEQRLNDYFKSLSPFHFTDTGSGTNLEGLNLFIDCGDDEETLTETNDAFHDILRTQGISHEYRVRDGAHTWDYWHSAMPEALRYIASAVREIPYPADPDPVEIGAAVPQSRLITSQTSDNRLSFTVMVPANYTDTTVVFPLMVVLHDRTPGTEARESEHLMALLNSNMTAYKLPQSLVVEIDLQELTFYEIPQARDLITEVIGRIRGQYRISESRNQLVLIGNDRAGALAWQLAPSLSLMVNSCLLFDAGLPQDASSADTGVTYYLDISDQGVHFQGYHALYLYLKEQEIPFEYRVRQGTPSHASFLTGLNLASQFIKDHLKIKRS